MLTLSSAPTPPNDSREHDLETKGGGAVGAAAGLFMATEPAAHITARDQRRLASLAAAALSRLEPLLGPADLAALTGDLAAAVGAAGAAGADHGIVVAVSPMSCQSMLLPSTPAASIGLSVGVGVGPARSAVLADSGDIGSGRAFPPRRSGRWLEPPDDRPRPVETVVDAPRSAGGDRRRNLVAAGARRPGR